MPINNNSISKTALDLKADDNEVVHLIGNESISGIKTFNDGVAIATNPTNNTSGFEYGNGFDPSLYSTNYENERFRINSSIETPFFSAGIARNFLLYSEDFSNAAWVKTDIASITANNAIAPNFSTIAENVFAGTSDSANLSQAITNSTVGDWAFGIWLRAQSGTCTVKIRIDSSAETGTEKEINLSTVWQYFGVVQNFTLAHSTKTARIISGRNAISVWGARCNPGSSANAYYATTSGAQTGLTAGIRFNNTTIYGNLSGNATNATNATYTVGGSIGTGTISNTTDNTNKWVYVGYFTLTYNSGYLFGRSINQWFNVSEYSRLESDVANADYENFNMYFKANLGYTATTTVFNDAIPTMSMCVRGKTNLTSDDICALVYSTSTSTKVIRIYMKLKSAHKHYAVAPMVYGNLSYTSSYTYTNSSSYLAWTPSSASGVVTTLPTPAQGSIIYPTFPQREDADGNFSVQGQLVSTSFLTAPTPVQGGIYFNDTDKHFYGYNGTTWKQLDN